MLQYERTAEHQRLKQTDGKSRPFLILQEVPQRVRHRLRILQHRHVTDSPQRKQPRPRDRRLDLLRLRDRNQRIRIAVAEAATIREVTLPFQGRSIAAKEISITPYADDPLRARFEQLINKRYVFTLSDAVPGGVLSIRTQVDAPTAGTPPLLAEEMALERQAPAVKP